MTKFRTIVANLLVISLAACNAHSTAAAQEYEAAKCNDPEVVGTFKNLMQKANDSGQVPWPSFKPDYIGTEFDENSITTISSTGNSKQCSILITVNLDDVIPEREEDYVIKPARAPACSAPDERGERQCFPSTSAELGHSHVPAQHHPKSQRYKILYTSEISDSGQGSVEIPPQQLQQIR